LVLLTKSDQRIQILPLFRISGKYGRRIQLIKRFQKRTSSST
jgi:hypothetical protein